MWNNQQSLSVTYLDYVITMKSNFHTDNTKQDLQAHTSHPYKANVITTLDGMTYTPSPLISFAETQSNHLSQGWDGWIYKSYTGHSTRTATIRTPIINILTKVSCHPTQKNNTEKKKSPASVEDTLVEYGFVSVVKCANH